MVNRESGSKPALSPSDAASATRTTVRPVDRARVFRAGLPFLALGSVASAYGFLERNKGHPSLKLGGAFFVAGLAVITVLLDRSMVLRNRSRQAIQHAVLVRRDRRDVLRIALAFLSLDAALVHFAVIEQHFTEYWLYGVFFVAVGVFELVWSLVVMAAPSTLVYWLSVIVNSLTVAAYVITRTVGLLVGPSASSTEKVGFGDLITTAFEAVLVVGPLLLLVPSWGRTRVRATASEAWIATVATAVTALTVLALFSTVGGPPFVTPAG